MAAEHSLKAVLILLGIDVPKRHDLSEILYPLIDNVQLPQRFRKNIPRLARISKELAAIRAAAGYGYEKALQPDYFKPKAQQAMEDASFAYEVCSQLIEELAPP
jgi:HEPN domain-containing protein